MKKLNFLLLTLSMIFLVGCKKYDEGGNSFLMKNKIEGSWTLIKYEENGEDKTNDLLGLRLQFFKDSKYIRTYLLPFNIESSNKGTWEVIEAKSTFVLNTEDNEVEKYTILKLTDSEFKVSDANNTKTIFTFKKD